MHDASGAVAQGATLTLINVDMGVSFQIGKITALRLGPNDQRQVQLALKYYF